MKKTYLLLFLGFFLMNQLTAQSFSAENYKNEREQNAGLTDDELAAKYPRPADFYYKGFSNGPDLSRVHYLDSVKLKLKLTEDELSLMEQNLFVVTERLSHNSFGNAFHTIYNHDLPVFITTDAILYALHSSYGQILKTMEREIMAANLEEFLKSLYDNFGQLTRKYANSEQLADGLKDADLFTTIAYSLITDRLQEPHVADTEKLQNIWDAVNSEKMVSMPLFTYPERNRKLDFSQFKVRGHYVHTQQDERRGLKSLEPYFRAMMWLGRIDFLLSAPPENPWERPWSDEEIQRMHYGAFMVNELTQNSEQIEKLQFNEKVINYLVGESDNLTPSEYNSVLKKEGINSAEQLADLETFLQVKSELTGNTEFVQDILSSLFIADPGAETPGELPISFRLSGQRFIIDSYILGNVVYDRLIYNGSKVKRMMPDPLDALFTLGNNDVLPLLQEEFDRYPYAEQLANLRYLVDHKSSDFWNSGLYNVWLNSIRKLNPKEENPAHPLFMKTAAWHQQKINTQMAGWSHLRHDNLLYAKQSYTNMAGCSFPHSYIEPYPEFYRQLKYFAQSAGEFFSQLPDSKYAIRKIIHFFPNFGEVMGKLEILAEKQLEGAPFSEEENEWLKSMLFRDLGSGMPPYSGWYTNLFFDKWDAAKGDFTVVDVHTQPTDENGNIVGKVLHTGVGQINLGVFLAESPSGNGELMAFTGPVMSYYEKITDNFLRLTDQAWEQLVEDKNLPERPEWTNIYLADNQGAIRKDGVNLPYHFYTGTEEVTNQTGLRITAFPNPVNNILYLSLHSDKTTTGSVRIFSSTGTLVKTADEQIIYPGKTTLTIGLDDLPKGIYITKVTTGDKKSTAVKIIKK